MTAVKKVASEIIHAFHVQSVQTAKGCEIDVNEFSQRILTYYGDKLKRDAANWAARYKSFIEGDAATAPQKEGDKKTTNFLQKSVTLLELTLGGDDADAGLDAPSINMDERQPAGDSKATLDNNVKDLEANIANIAINVQRMLNSLKGTFQQRVQGSADKVAGKAEKAIQNAHVGKSEEQLLTGLVHKFQAVAAQISKEYENKLAPRQDESEAATSDVASQVSKDTRSAAKGLLQSFKGDAIGVSNRVPDIDVLDIAHRLVQQYHNGVHTDIEEMSQRYDHLLQDGSVSSAKH
eukprot:gnl/TRDRNA2_/TRDRNA2_174314_c1_seq46.p1 gnl/TRDRNA2_/TRDRNA2_174314_c1~~gnl/TRDRNA2_/TRDRNA2_174314_c1_seq46.p1  ORF type:complete len:315 (+),score=78.17 gnl/TRDRNA2_/TRDRNA2_174314_c1_seq46:67-945(+)